MTVTLGVPCFDTCELFTHFFAWGLPQASPSQATLSHLSFSVLWIPVWGREVGSRGVCVDAWRVFVFLSFSSLFPLGVSSLIFY